MNNLIRNSGLSQRYPKALGFVLLRQKTNIPQSRVYFLYIHSFSYVPACIETVIWSVISMKQIFLTTCNWFLKRESPSGKKQLLLHTLQDFSELLHWQRCVAKGASKWKVGCGLPQLWPTIWDYVTHGVGDTKATLLVVNANFRARHRRNSGRFLGLSGHFFSVPT